MNVLYPSFALVFGLLSVFTNGLSGFILYHNRSLTFGSPIVYYLVTLACMYFIKGVLTVCWSISVLVKSSHVDLFFRIGQCGYWTTALSLFLTLFAMVIERYINTVSLNQLQWLRARKRVYIYFCLIIVVFSLICGQLVALDDTGRYVEFFICLVAEVAYMLTIIVFINFWLKHNSKAKENVRHQEITQITTKYRPEFDSQKRLNIVVLCYILGTLITVLPFFVAFQARLVCVLFYNNNDNKHLKKLLDVYRMFTCLNYGLTPLFYICVLPKFKTCLYLLLTCQASRRTPLQRSIVTQESEETTSGGEFV